MSPASSERPQSDDVLDADTYAQIREPRNGNRLPLGDGAWHQISPKYVTSQVLQTAISMLLIAAAAVVIALFAPGTIWMTFALIAAGITEAMCIASLIVLPRQARALGYMLRDDDVVFRKGILWQRIVAVPYGRMQLVDISHGPLDRAFGIAKLKMVTAAATTGVEIPGLTQVAAELLRDTLIEVAESRRTGL